MFSAQSKGEVVYELFVPYLLNLSQFQLHEASESFAACYSPAPSPLRGQNSSAISAG